MQLGARESRHVQEDHVERNSSGGNDTHTHQRFLEVRGYCRAETLPNVRGLSRFQEGLGLLQMTTNEKSNRTYHKPSQKGDTPAPTVERLWRKASSYESPQQCADEHSQALPHHLPRAVKAAPMWRSGLDEKGSRGRKLTAGGKSLQQSR